ncbi:MAG: WG repeat-containing protein [Chitinophagaceae bacterium]
MIPFDYETLTPVTTLGNYATVSKKESGKNVYGLVNGQNKAVIPLIYEDIIADSNLVSVKENGKWGVMDITGKKLLPAEYASLTLYAKEKTVKTEKDGKIILLDLSGKTLFEKVKNVYTLNGPSQGMLVAIVNNKYGYLDLKGDEVIITKYDYAYNFESNGLGKVGRKTSGSSYTKYGYIDKKGTEVIPLVYETLGSFSNGLVYAKDGETNRYGYLDKTGKWVIQPTYLEALAFDAAGGAWVKMTDAKYHYINKAGKDLGAMENSYKNFSTDGYALYEHTDNPFVLIDKTGKTIKVLEDCDAIYTFSEGIAGYKCKSNSKYGFIDYTGKIISSCNYDGFSGFNDGISRVEKKVDSKTKYGYINTKGEVVVPVEYDILSVYRNGWGVAKKDGNYYFVDKTGNLKDPARKYDELYEFRSGFAMGTVNGTNSTKTYYYINTDLKEEFNITAKEGYLFWENVAVVKREKDYELMNKKGEVFKTLTGISTLKFCSDGMLAVKENGKWGYIDDKGTTVIPSKYDSCEVFKYGYGRYRMNSKWGLLDKTGKEVTEAKYENILSGENGIFIFYDNGWGIMDKTGKVIIPSKLYTITPFEKDRALARLGKSYSILRSPLVK